MFVKDKPMKEIKKYDVGFRMLQLDEALNSFAYTG